MEGEEGYNYILRNRSLISLAKNVVGSGEVERRKETGRPGSRNGLVALPLLLVLQPRQLMGAAGSPGRSHGVTITASGSNLRPILCLPETNSSQPGPGPKGLQSQAPANSLRASNGSFVLKGFSIEDEAGPSVSPVPDWGALGEHSNSSHFSFLSPTPLRAAEMLYSEQCQLEKTRKDWPVTNACSTDGA